MNVFYTNKIRLPELIKLLVQKVVRLEINKWNTMNFNNMEKNTFLLHLILTSKKRIRLFCLFSAPWTFLYKCFGCLYQIIYSYPNGK